MSNEVPKEKRPDSRLIMSVVILLILVVIYLAISPRSGLLSPLWHSMIFYPSKDLTYYKEVESICGINQQDISFTAADGNSVHGWLYLLPGAKQIVIVSHGNAGNLSGRWWIAEQMLLAGSSVLMYDYEGYGKSEGFPTVERIVEDGTAAYEYCKVNLGFAPNNIVLYGESLGCAVSCAVAQKHPCAGLILQSGFSSLRQLAIEKIPLLAIYPPFLFPEPALDNGAIVSKLDVPVLVIHGDSDTLIPVAHAKQVKASVKSNSKLIELDGIGHNDVFKTANGLYGEEVKMFLLGLRQKTDGKTLQN